MKYKFIYKNNTLDFWRLSIYYTYGSIVGVCNIIFTVAIILLSLKVWTEASSIIRILLVIACCLFPIIQPIGIYNRAKRQAAAAKEIELSIGETGIHINMGNESSNLEWNTIKKISKKLDMIVIFSTSTHGFILTNKVLGKQKDEFYNYLISKVN